MLPVAPAVPGVTTVDAVAEPGCVAVLAVARTAGVVVAASSGWKARKCGAFGRDAEPSPPEAAAKVAKLTIDVVDGVREWWRLRRGCWS